jgi:hypothetical protein
LELLFDPVAGEIKVGEAAIVGEDFKDGSGGKGRQAAKQILSFHSHLSERGRRTKSITRLALYFAAARISS